MQALGLDEERVNRAAHDLRPRPAQKGVGVAAACQDAAGVWVHNQEAPELLHLSALHDRLEVFRDLLLLDLELKRLHRVAYVVVAAGARDTSGGGGSRSRSCCCCGRRLGGLWESA